MHPFIVHISALLMGQCSPFTVEQLAGGDCGILGQAGANGHALSKSGAICGEVSLCNGDQHPFVRFPGTPLVVLTAAGAADSGEALAVNASGVVIGNVDVNPLSFRYVNSRVQLFQALSGSSRSEVGAINDGGVAAGASAGDVLRATYWVGTSPIALSLCRLGRAALQQISTKRTRFADGWALCHFRWERRPSSGMTARPQRSPYRRKRSMKLAWQWR